MAEEDTFLPKYRILDLTDEKGTFCTKLLADLGADVIKVEPPSGDKTRAKGPFFQDDIHPEKSLYFLYYNTNKRSITLDLSHHDGRAIFKRLVQKADAVVETFTPGYLDSLGLAYDSLSALNPRLVMVSITPFGQTGPWNRYKSSDLIVMAASGYMQVTGEPDEPPVRPGNEQSHFAPSQYAAVTLLAALYWRDNCSNEGQYIDVSMQEACITYYQDQHPAALWHFKNQNVIRVGRTSNIVVPLGIYPCKDGWIGLGLARADEWDRLAQWVYEVTGDEVILEDRFKGATQARAPYIDEITAMLVNFCSHYTKEEMFKEGQRRDLVFVPVAYTSELPGDPQLEAMNFWVDLEHPIVGSLKYPLGIFYSADMPLCKRPAPLLGQDNEKIYCGELGFSKEDLAIMRKVGVV